MTQTQDIRCNHGQTMPIILSIAVPAGVAVAAALACLLAAGPTLGAIFGGMIFLTILLPPMALSQTTATRRTFAAVATFAGISAVWLAGMNVAELPVFDRLKVIAVLGAYAWALLGIVLLLARVRAPSVGSAAVVLIIGLGWLTWPIWLTAQWSSASPSDAGEIVATLIRYSPPLVANGVLGQTQPWTEEPIAYRDLTSLNQDIPYTLPDSATPCIVFHGVIGAALCLATIPRRRWVKLFHAWHRPAAVGKEIMPRA